MIAEYSRKQSALSPEKVEIGTQTDESLYTMDIERKDWEPIKTDKLPTVATIDGEENTSEAAKSLLDLILKDQAAQEKLERYQNEDEYMRPILNYLKFGSFESTSMPYRMKAIIKAEAEKYQVLNKLLYTKEGKGGRVQLVVPKALREQLIYAHHDNVTNAHRSAAQTFEAVKNNYHWQGMHSDIAYYVQNCNVCALVKRAQQTWLPPMHSAIIPYLPGVKWSLDFLERLVETPEGYKDALMAVEKTTTFVVAEPVKALTAETVAEFLYKRLFMIFGIA